MSSIITESSLASFMPGITINTALATTVVDGVNQYIEDYTNRCWGEVNTVTERYDWAPEIYLRHQDINTNGGPNVAFMGVPTLAETSSATGGQLAAGTYYYVVTALSTYGQIDSDVQYTTAETAPSNEVTVTTTGSTSSVALSWNPLVQASGYNIYRGTASGKETLLASVSSGTTFTDTGIDTPGTQTPPAVSGGMTVILGYPNKMQEQLDNTSFFWDQWGRVTMYLQQPRQFNPSAVNNDLVQITYTYGVVNVPADMQSAALAIAANYYNWCVNGQKDVVSANIGNYRLEFEAAVRGVGGGPDGNAPPVAHSTMQMHWNTLNRYRMRHL